GPASRGWSGRRGLRGVRLFDGAAGRRSGGQRGTRRRTAGVIKARKSPAGTLIELAVIVVTALGLALAVQAFLIKPYRIPSGSMLPTVKVGQRVLVNRLGNRFNDPKVGEIVVFHPPAGAEGDGNTCGDPNRQASVAACDKPTPQKAGVNFIKRVV